MQAKAFTASSHQGASARPFLAGISGMLSSCFRLHLVQNCSTASPLLVRPLDGQQETYFLAKVQKRATTSKIVAPILRSGLVTKR